MHFAYTTFLTAKGIRILPQPLTRARVRASVKSHWPATQLYGPAFGRRPAHDIAFGRPAYPALSKLFQRPPCSSHLVRAMSAANTAKPKEILLVGYGAVGACCAFNSSRSLVGCAKIGFYRCVHLGPRRRQRHCGRAFKLPFGRRERVRRAKRKVR